jgi:hypothetical protein
MQWFAGSGSNRHNELDAAAAIYGQKEENFWTAVLPVGLSA